MILFQSTKKYEKPKPKVARTKITKDQWEEKTRLKPSNISLLPYLLYCNIDLNLLHNYCCHHISRNDFVQLFKCTFQKNKKIIKKKITWKLYNSFEMKSDSSYFVDGNFVMQTEYSYKNTQNNLRLYFNGHILTQISKDQLAKRNVSKP